MQWFAGRREGHADRGLQRRPAAAPGKARPVVHYRTFRNTDPPGLVDVWNACFTGRGAAYVHGPGVLEYFLFAKPYFDPDGLIVALEGSEVVGFAHAGFGPN